MCLFGRVYRVRKNEAEVINTFSEVMDTTSELNVIYILTHDLLWRNRITDIYPCPEIGCNSPVKWITNPRAGQSTEGFYIAIYVPCLQITCIPKQRMVKDILVTNVKSILLSNSHSACNHSVCCSANPRKYSWVTFALDIPIKMFPDVICRTAAHNISYGVFTCQCSTAWVMLLNGA